MSTKADNSTQRKRSHTNRAERWLQFCFAVLSCLGGFVLSSGEDAELIPLIAVFFAVFGFVFVDWLKVFSLPPVVAYVAMGVAAVYCVGDFWENHTTGNEQMIAVALLLVLVQAILMLQRKTPRIFEQLAVFCLLQLVVGAVFNDAISFGLLLLPIGIIGALGLSLMSGVAASEGIATTPMEWDSPTRANQNAAQQNSQTRGSVDSDPPSRLDRLASHWIFRPIGSAPTRTKNVRSWGPRSIELLASATRPLQRYGLLALAPAIVLVSFVFFYALPRTTNAARMSNRGRALVGFDDQISLSQIGQMHQSNETAMRIELINRRLGSRYLVSGSLYLRGKVLENYRPDVETQRPTASWTSIKPGKLGGSQDLPREFVPKQISDETFYDSVIVRVSCRSMRARSLFAIAPYHRTAKLAGVVHAADRWTIRHREHSGFAHPPIEYEFGTNAFFNGVQQPIISRVSLIGRMMSASYAESDAIMRFADENHDDEDRSEAARARRYDPLSYLGQLTQFDPKTMPTIAEVSQELLDSISPERRTLSSIARKFSEHLRSEKYEYTLNLNAKPIKGMDPIEQFISVDRRGHCQYFASALAMMLRSVNIPARIVVGYRTEEYNDLGQYYVARQSHAHAWVEALMDRSQLDQNATVFGQPRSNQYWIRLDPTPGASAAPQSQRVDNVMNLAEDIWDKYVVGMDAKRQGETLGESVSPSVASLSQWFLTKLALIRSGNLGRGSFSFRNSSAWYVLLGILGLIAGAFGLFRLAAWLLSRISFGQARTPTHGAPEIAFYAETLQCLAKVGLVRDPAHTPVEFANEIKRRCQHAEVDGVSEPLDFLTEAFVRQRYGRTDRRSPPENSHESDAEASMLQDLRSAIHRVASDESARQRLMSAGDATGA